MVRAELTIESSQGIHLGPASLISDFADKFDSEIYFKTDNMDINAKSIINIVSASLRKGDKVLCVCNGPDEKDALAAMKEFMAQDLEILWSNKE